MQLLTEMVGDDVVGQFLICQMVGLTPVNTVAMENTQLTS